MATEIRVPTLGESVSEATIGTWFKKAGDPVRADEPVVELETDKVTLEVPAPAAGVLAEIAAQSGETVEVDALLGMIAEAAETPAGNAETAPQPAAGEPPAAEKPAPDKPAPSGKLVEIVVPSGGESVTEATVGDVYKAVGDSVATDEMLLELETDKAAQEVPSPVSGVIRELLVKSGDDVEVGALLMKIEEGASTGTGAQAAASEATDAQPASAASSMPPAPSAQKMMAENDLASGQIAGSGKRGQVLKGDVIETLSATARATAPQAAPISPTVATVARAPSAVADEAREERVKMTRLRQTIARRLKDAQNTAAMLTTYNEVDMSAVMDLRARYKELFEKKHGVKLGFMGFFTKAVCHALREIPAVNAEIDGTDIIYKNYAHIGVAVGTDKGLVVPVVRDADQMSIADIEKEISRLGRASRDGELTMTDMQGGTFTLSNGGVYGSLMSSPILNAPQSGILGMHKIQERPVAVAGQVVIRPMMYLALSYDHRIVDGKEAVTFLVRVKESLEDPERLVLDL